MAEYIGRLFPERIEEYFEDVTYVFKPRACDTYGFEAMLEFTIEDEVQFQTFVTEATQGLYARTFHYDPAFQEYVVYDTDDGFVHDSIMLGKLCCREADHGRWNGGRECFADPHPGQFFSIDSAKIAKVLVNREEHRIIYAAMGVHDGGGSSTDFFCEYLERFGIDPKEYETYTNEIARFDKSLVTKVSFVTVAADGTITEHESLDENQYSSFFRDFSDCKYYYNWKKPVGAVSGSAILITFRDGTEYLVNHKCTIRTINGEKIDTLEYYDAEVFFDFWSIYTSCDYSIEGGAER